MDRSVPATETKMEVVIRAQNTNLSASLRIFFLTSPVVAKSDRFGPSPFLFNRKAVRIGRLAKTNG